MGTAWLHISCVLRRSGMSLSAHGLLRTASLHISCVLRWSGTHDNKIGSVLTVSLHISFVLKWSGINAKECGFLLTSSLHTSWTPGIYFSIRPKTCTTKHSMIYPIAFLIGLIILFIPLGSGEDVVMLTTYKEVVSFNHIHNSHPNGLVHRQNLSCWLYAQQLIQALDNYQMYTRKDIPGQSFDL